MGDLFKSYFNLNSIIGILLLLSAFAASLFFGGLQDITYAPAALLLLGFACVAVIPAFWRGLELPKVAAALLFFAFWLYITLSLMWTNVPYASLVTYLIIIALPLCFFALLLSPDKETLAPALGGVLWAALAGLALWAVIQHIFFQHLFGDRAHHPLPNPNNLAGLLNLGFLPALALLLSTREKSRWFYGALGLSLLFFTGLIATGSRGALLCALIAVLLLVFLLRGAAPNLGKRFALFILPAAGLFFLLSSTGGTPAQVLASLAATGSDASAHARIAIWQSALQMFKDHLWTGTGLGTFYLFYPSYRLPGADNSTGSWAHMDPLQFGIEMGIIAPLLFYALCFAILLRTVRALRLLGAEAPERTVIAGVFCALLTLALHSHLTFNLYIMPILITAGVLLALWYLYTAQVLEDGFHPVTLDPWQRPFMALVTVVIASLIGLMAVSSAAGQYHLNRAQDLIKQGLPDQFTAEIEKAETWAPRSFIDPEVQLAAFYIDLLGPQASALFSPAEQDELYSQTAALLDSAAQMNPAWAEIDYQRGRLYALTDKETDSAIAALNQAIGKNPMQFSARSLLATLYIRRGQVETAYGLLQTGLRYPHNKEINQSYRAQMQKLEGLVAAKRAYEQGRAP